MPKLTRPEPRRTQLKNLALRAIIFLQACTFLTAATAQLDGRLAERPIGVGYVRDVTQVTVVEYMQSLSGRLNIGKTMLEGIPDGQLEALQSRVDVPINGACWYMVQGLLPSFETISFQEVVDAADAKRVLEGRRKMMGDRGQIETESEGRYKFFQSSSWSSPVSEGSDPQQQVDAINKQNQGNNRSFRISAKIVEKDGQQQIEQSWTMTEYYRFHDNLLFSAGFEELWDIDLPSRESLTSSISSSNDMGVEAFFDRIPQAMKLLGWNMLSASAGTQMQRRDEEEQTIADLRQSALTTGLEIVRAVMFDVEQTNGWIRFATDDEPSVRGEINFAARRNSALTKQLDDLASETSRFAPILEDGSAVTLHCCARLSEESADVPRTAAAWLQHAVTETTSGGPVMVDAVTKVTETLNAFADRRVLEAFVKVGWSEASDGVIYGGLQVDDNPGLLQGLYEMAVSVPGAPADVTDAIGLTEINGQAVLQFRIPDDFLKELNRLTSLRLTHVFVTHQNSCLWFAFGGENALEIVNHSIARCSASGFAARTPLITARVDAERWLSYPQDDPSGVGGLLSWLDANRWEFPPGPMTGMMFGRSPKNKPTPLLQPCFDLGGARTGSFTVLADNSGVRASFSLGEALANYYLARMIGVQENVMRRQVEQAEEQQRKAQATPEQVETKPESSGN